MAEEKGQINPLDKSNQTIENSKLIQNIVDTETEEPKDILGEAPEVDTSLLQEIEPPKSALLIGLKTFFAVLLIASIGSILFFTSQLSNALNFVAPKLGLDNISKNLASTNTEIIGLQTDLNLFRYLKIKASLDRFSYDGDRYLQYFENLSSVSASQSDKAEAAGQLEILRPKLKKSYMAARDRLVENFAAPLIDRNYADQVNLDSLYIGRLKEKYLDKIQNLVNADDDQSRRDVKNLRQTLALAGNSKAKELVLEKDFDALSDEELYKYIKDLNSAFVNDLSTIREVKSKRIKWSDIINEIESRTITVDQYYSDDFYDALGGIRYTSYDFDTSNKTISIVGETKRFDTSNFTMIANLIDELNRSKLFEGVLTNSFNKTGSLDEGYLAILKLSMNLEN